MSHAKRWLGAVALLLLCWQVNAVAATTTVTQTANGYGATPAAATSAALVAAARQVLGVALTLDPDFRSQSAEWVVHQNKNGNVITQQWSSAPEPRLPLLAGIKSYRVTQLTQANKALWHAEVEAKIVTDKPLKPGRDILESMVVIPFSVAGASIDLRGQVVTAQVSANLRRALVASLTQSGQVRVLDRTHAAARVAEQLQSAHSLNPAQRAKLGRNMGADLLLTGRIDSFRFGRAGQQFYGADNSSLALHVRLHYQLVDVATGDILAANTLTYDPPAAQLQAAFRAADIVPTTEPQRLGEVIYPQVATRVSNAVLNHIAPLQVLKVVDNTTIYISGGEGRVQVGDLLAISQHTTLQNPQTGAAINARNVTSTRLKVTQVAAGYAVATRQAAATAAQTDTAQQTHAGVIKAGARLTWVVAPPQAIPETHPMTPGSSPKPISWN